MAKRHGGVIAFGVLGIVSGIIGSIANGLLLLMLLVARSRTIEMDAHTQAVVASVNAGMLAALAVNVVTSALAFVPGIGIFTYTSWARLGYLAAVTLTIINRLVTFPMHFQQSATPNTGDTLAQLGYQIGNVGGDIGTIIFSGLVLWFFNRSTIKSLFTHASTTPSPP